MKWAVAQLLACLCYLAPCPILAGQPAIPSRSPDLPTFQAARPGAIARTLNEKLTDTISVKDFGAKGDNTTDDTAAIQAAINSVSAAGGGTIFFPPGIYLIASPGTWPHGNIINLKSNLTIAGAGRNATQIKLKDNTYSALCNPGVAGYANLFSTFDTTSNDTSTFSSFSNIHFRDLTINVNGSHGNAWNPGPKFAEPRVVLQLGDTSNVSIERVDFLDTDVGNVIVIGLGLERKRICKNFRVTDCTFADPTSNNPLSFDNSQILALCDNTYIAGNRFINTTRQGRMISTATEIHGNNTTFINNVITGMRQALFICAEKTINPLLTNVVVSGNTADNLNFAFATFWSDAVDGRPGGVGREIRNVVISDNTVNIAPIASKSTPGGVADATAYFLGTVGGNGWGAINQVQIHHNSVSMSNPPDWQPRTAYLLGDLRTTNGQVYRVITAGTSGARAPAGTGADIKDASVHWAYMSGYEIKTAIWTTQDVAEWEIAGNFFKSFNVGIWMQNLKDASSGAAVNRNNSIKGNRFVECANQNNDIIIYLDNVGAAVPGTISNLVIEDNQFVNSTPQARPIYVAAVTPTNYRITNNGAVNFTPTTAPVTIVGVPTKLVFGDTQYYPRQTPTYGPTVAIDASLGNEFVITPTNGNAFTISDPTNSTPGQRITIRVRNTIGALGPLRFGSLYKAAPWAQPTKGYSRSIDFQFDGAHWIEASRTPADVPN